MITFALPLPHLAVVPILIGPLQVLLAVLPAILVAIGGALLALFKPSSIKLFAKVLWRNKVATLLTAAVVAGLCYGLPKARQYFWPSRVARFTGKAEWTMFRGGLSRRGGGTDGAPDPVGGGTVWSFARDFKTYYSSPAIVGNRVIASAAKKGVFADRGAIYCLDATNGAVAWEFAPSDFRATFSSPSVNGKYVVCGEGLHLTTDARIICLGSDDKDVRKLWEVKTTSHVESSPCFYSNMVFCGAGADGVYGLRLDTPAGTSPVAWHLKSLHDAGLNETNTFHCDGSTAAYDGRVYFSSAELHPGDWSGVACVNAANGQMIWKVDTTMPVWGSPTIVSNRLFIGMGNGNFVETAEEYWARKQQELRKEGKSKNEIDALAPKYAAGGELWDMDALTGKKNWVRKLRKTLLGAVAAADGKLYFAASDGLFTCITLDNELVAQWDAHEGIKTSPAIGSNCVYVATDSGRFYGLDRRTLKPVWQTRLGNGDLFTSSPAVGLGHIYIGTPEDGVICLGSPADQQIETVWGGARGTSGNAGTLDGSTLPAKGSFAWRWPADSAADKVPSISGDLACVGNTLYVPVASGSQTGLAAMAVSGGSAATTAAAKAPETNKWFAATALPVSGAVAATTRRVYFVEGRMGDSNRSLRCVDAAAGRELWRTPVDAAASGEFFLTRSNLLAFCRAGELVCLDTREGEAGRTLWSAAVGRTVGAPCLAGDLALAATGKDGVVAVRCDTGKVLWKQASPATPVSGLAANDDVVAVATSNGLAGLSLANGGQLWSILCAPSTAPLAADEDRLVCVTADGDLLAASWSGRELCRIKGATPGLPVLLLGDKVLFCTRDAFQKIDFSEKNAESRWLATAWLGALTTPPILSDGSVYFATAERGLICARQGKR